MTIKDMRSLIFCLALWACSSAYPGSKEIKQIEISNNSITKTNIVIRDETEISKITSLVKQLKPVKNHGHQRTLWIMSLKLKSGDLKIIKFSSLIVCKNKKSCYKMSKPLLRYLKRRIRESEEKGIKFWVNRLYLINDKNKYGTNRTKFEPSFQDRLGKIEQMIVSHQLDAFPHLIRKIPSTKPLKNRPIRFFEIDEGQLAICFLLDWIQGWKKFDELFGKDKAKKYLSNGHWSFWGVLKEKKEREYVQKRFKNWFSENKKNLRLSYDGNDCDEYYKISRAK